MRRYRTPALIAAYATTSYRVHDGAAWCEARIGLRAPAIEALLVAHRAWIGAFITGWNPLGRRAGVTANGARNRAMLRVFAARGLVPLPHTGASPSGDWAEDGFFVPHLKPASALRAARIFGQLAVVVVRRGRAVELLWT